MKISNEEKAKVLIDALPYIQKYYNKVVVVKYGGNAMIDDELKQAVMSDVVLLSLIGIKVVLVHGGGPEINAMLDRVGIPTATRQILYRWCLPERSTKALFPFCRTTAAKRLDFAVPTAA